MKKYILSAAVLFFSVCVNAVSFKQYFETGIGWNAARSVEEDLVNSTFGYGFDLEGINCDFAVQANEDIFDFTYTNFSWLLKTEYSFLNLSYGMCGNIHMQYYYSVSTTYDLVGGFCFKTESRNNFTFTATTGYGLKSTGIFALEDYEGRLYSHWFAASILFDKVWENGFEASFSMTTHDNFRFPVFISPSYIFEAAWNYGEMRLSCSAQIRFADQFTVAPYMDMVVLRTGLRYRF